MDNGELAIDLDHRRRACRSPANHPGAAMKAGWVTRRLGDVVTRLTNGYVGPTRDIYLESGVPYLLARHVRDNRLAFDGKTFISDEFNRKHKKSMLKAGDVLLVQSGHIGHTAVVTDEHEGHNCHAMIVITPVDDAVTGDFLSLYFNSPGMRQKFDEIRSGSTVPHLTCGAVKELMIPLPSLAEQRRIVGILDEAFEGLAAAKANAEQNLQNARALFESHLQAVFTQRGDGWVEKRIQDVCLTFGRGKSRHRPRNEPSLYGGDYPFIQTGDLSNADHVVTTYSQTYNDKGLAQSKLWPKGTVGIAIVGATIGESGVLGFDACFPDSVIGMTVKPTIADPFFLEYMLQHFKGRVKSHGAGSARENINIGTFDALLFPMPPVSEQRRIVEKVDDLKNETQRLESLFQRKLAALDELKKSLLHRAFSGQL